MTGTHQGYKFLSRSARTNLPCHVDSLVTFSPDGSQMAFVRNDGVKGESSLILADPSGAHETHLATRRIGNDIGPFDLPSWAPDGRTKIGRASCRERV